MANDKLTCRYLARVVIEADTPLSVGAGNKNEVVDRLTIKDMYGLPYIPGTSIAGVLRHAFKQNVTEDILSEIFGSGGDQGAGSRLIFTDACLVGRRQRVIEGVCEPTSILGENYRALFQALPNRQHVRIGHKGVGDSENMGKYDEEVVNKGVRFVFEMELMGTPADQPHWEHLLAELRSPLFRLGGGSRKGFGRLKIIDLHHRVFDLAASADDLQVYLDRPAGLQAVETGFWRADDPAPKAIQANVARYRISLKADDFFLFRHETARDGFDASQKVEDIVVWDADHEPHIEQHNLVVPGSSVKGALAHRVAFHYNKQQKTYADQLNVESFNDVVGENNSAVAALFGTATVDQGFRGAMLFADAMLNYDEQKDAKVFNHVKIDRLTGGAVAGALFNERTAHVSEDILLEVVLDVAQFRTNMEKMNMTENQDAFIKAWEAALDDLCSGALPLGGGVNLGHGRFHGKWEKL